MTCIDSSCVADPLLDFEQPVSLPPAPPVADPAADAAATADDDSFQTLARPPAYLSPGPGRGAAAAPPQAPVPPRTPIPEGFTEDQAIDVLKADWTTYRNDYGQYLARFDEALQRCSSLEELRRLEPEPPDAETMSELGFRTAAQRLRERYLDFFEKKVDRGYALAGEALPGTFELELKARGSVGLGAVAGLEAGLKASSRGEVEAETRGLAVVRLDLGPVQASATRSSDGKSGASVAVHGVGLKASSEGELGVRLGAAAASLDAREARLTGEVTLFACPPGGLVDCSATASGSLKAMSARDAQRALDGWLVPPRDEDAEQRWLREQQLKAQLTR